MHISDMLNPENHSEQVYSPPKTLTRTQNTGNTNVPRSTISPVAQLSSLPSVNSHYKVYDSYNSAPECLAALPIGSRHEYNPNPPKFHSQNRILPADSAICLPSASYRNPSSDYANMHLDSSRIPMPSPSTLQGRPVQNRNTLSISQGSYSHAQPQGTDSLATLATLATSRDFRDYNRPETRRWGSVDHHGWDRQSTTWSHQALGVECGEAQSRRDSQPWSPHDTVNEFETLPSPLSSGSSRRTVSVGSQTSRPNTPERGRQGVLSSRVPPAGICTASAFLNEGSSSNRSSSSSLASPISPSAERIPDSPSSDTVKADDDHKCSYTESCETGSPLRKVVSHFFGRNKLATRKIPKHLWVYFCRKHYQRSRYRNPRGFASLQIQLVQTQIGNLRRWGGVIDWTVKVRRREEMRSRTNIGANQDSEGANHADGDRGAVGESRVTRGRASGVGGSIPAHYLQYVGERKSMEEVTALVEAIQQDMEQNGGTFPDLELLPRVAGERSSGEGDEEHNDRAKGKRARVSRPRPAQVKKRKSTNVGDRGPAPTTAAEYTSIALSQRSGRHHITALSAISRSGTAPIQPAAAGTPTPYSGDATNVRPKRKLDIRCGDIELSATLSSEQGPTTPVHGIMGTPESPTKRRRFPQEMSSDGPSNKVQALAQDQQTVTPPASAPSVSRRTSLATECVASASCLNHTVLEVVDAALESVRVTSAVNTSSGPAV